MGTLFVVDLDGTVLDNRGRLAKAGSEPSRDDLPALFAWLEILMDSDLLKDDPQISGMKDMVWALVRGCFSATSGPTGNEIIYLTARNENLREVTTKWLSDNGFPELPLHMRGKTDLRRDADIKREVLRTFGTRPVVILDDDPSGGLARVCSEEGWTLLKAMRCLS